MDGTTLLSLYRKMRLIRRFEEEAARAYTERKVGGFLHLYIGQESVCTGVLAAREQEDKVIGSYRIHAHYLVCGGNARAGMAELYGKSTGCSGGRGGSMHFFNVKDNFFGGNGIVGSHVPVAAGMAFSSKYRGTKEVSICFLGEGATSIGPFHEGLCLAALWRLPVVFVVENNGYSMGTPLSRQMRIDDVSIRALGYPIARMTVEGYDVVDCYDAAKKAIMRAREESLPTLLEFKTYRYRGHSMADPAKYRTKDEVEEIKKHKDPLVLAIHRLERDFPELIPSIEEINREIDVEVADAVAFAEESPEPDQITLFDHNYVGAM